MDAIRPPVCMNLYLDWGRKKKNTGDILWPTSDHVSGIKVEEVRGLVGSFYTRLIFTTWLQKETNGTDGQISSYCTLYIPPPFSLSLSVCRHHWPLTSRTRLVFVQHLLCNQCLCMYDVSVPPIFLFPVLLKVSSLYRASFSATVAPLKVTVWVSVQLERISAWTNTIQMKLNWTELPVISVGLNWVILVIYKIPVILEFTGISNHWSTLIHINEPKTRWQKEIWAFIFIPHLQKSKK